VRFSRSINDVFSFEESSESCNACCSPHAPPNHRPSLHLHDTIVSAGLDNLTIETGWPKDAPDDFLIEVESIRGNQWKLSGIHALPVRCSFQPAMHRVPGNPLNSSDGGLVQAFDTEGGDFIEDCTPVLESLIRCTCCRAERLPTNLATVSTSFPPSCFVEAVTDDTFGRSFFR
jgi:hypothetical protein